MPFLSQELFVLICLLVWGIVLGWWFALHAGDNRHLDAFSSWVKVHLTHRSELEQLTAFGQIVWPMLPETEVVVAAIVGGAVPIAGMSRARALLA